VRRYPHRVEKTPLEDDPRMGWSDFVQALPQFGRVSLRAVEG
jgi:hypothetical protein